MRTVERNEALAMCLLMFSLGVVCGMSWARKDELEEEYEEA